MTRREAMRRGLPVLGIFRSFAAVGVDPSIMGVGPAYAIPAAVAQAGLAIEDIDVFEINEAFASQVGGAVAGWGACVTGCNALSFVLAAPAAHANASCFTLVLHVCAARSRP